VPLFGDFLTQINTITFSEIVSDQCNANHINIAHFLRCRR